jgi:hypothetical protein
MEQEIRNRLRNVVTQCRKLLEESVSEELEGKYAIFAKKDQVTADPNAAMIHLNDEEKDARRDILDHFNHIKARGFKPKDALDQLIREIAFTHLNRLCAYKMMEAREVYVGGQRFREAVSRGANSNGVKFYLADHSEDERLFNTGHQDVAYRHFLDWLGGLLSEEIGVLFNPNDPANRLYPRQKTLDEVLDLLNSGGLKPDEAELRESWSGIWSQDETIGWVYQYFTPKELRDQARKESAAPRNSYELAFRNQFFTPRYVVEFLTDNTLGRIWYEMRKGDTKLKDQCRYMVRRPTEVFLKQGEESPRHSDQQQHDLSQEELLNIPIRIPHRPKKDPRQLRILDPACGSGHFLLYCFDLLFTIYEEAYTDSDLGSVFQKDYQTLEHLRRDVPRLILAHNLHGIDIDLRASQIAALALWLRCQRAYQEIALKKDRPKITRSNFACAEPMPGEEQLLKQFVGELEPKFLGQVVEVVFDKMKLAGEAGSLLKIEEEIRDTVIKAREQWLAGPVLIQQSLFRDEKPVVQQQRFDFSGITDAQFFEQAEVKVIDALRNYAEKAHNGERLQRRLFAEDAVRGFAFVDVCSKRYDVVLMNPPFGDCSLPSRDYLYNCFADSKRNLACVFVEHFNSKLLPEGKLAAIAARPPLFTISFAEWRQHSLFHQGHIELLWDLGADVLDAMIETVAYVVSRSASLHSLLISIRTPKALSLADILETFEEARSSVYVTNSKLLEAIPGSPIAYWATPQLLGSFRRFSAFEGNFGTARQGLGTGDDFRFSRALCEVDPDQIGMGKKYVRYALGGSFRPFYEDIRTLVNWEFEGREMKEFERQRVESEGKPARGNGPMRECEYYYQPGFFFPRRTHRFCPKILPSGSIFSVGGQGIFPQCDEHLALLGLLSSKVGAEITALMLGEVEQSPQFEVGVIKRIPISPELANSGSIATQVKEIIDIVRERERKDENSSLFTGLVVSQEGLRATFKLWNEAAQSQKAKVIALFCSVDAVCCETYGTSSFSEDDAEESWYEAFAENEAECARAITSYFVGCLLGRWDIRFTLGSEPYPELPPIFDELPAYPPATLKTTIKEPLSQATPAYPLRVEWDGIIVDDADHPDDIVRRIRDVFEIIGKGRADGIEKETCEILGVKELRDYFRKPSKGGFWDDHIGRYSKSRRKAPLYWLLQSSKKNYALWLYYHRFDQDLLFKALVNHVEPKIRLELSRIESLRSQKSAAGESSKDAKRLAKEVERQEDFITELRDFEDKLRRAANLHLDPDRNDGVVLNIASLHELVPWKEAKNYWDELLAGKYEWSSIGKQLRQKGLVKSCQ